MNGHDNNTDDGMNNTPNNVNSGGSAQGIFSTPDLTVNTENLPQNQPVKTSNTSRFNFGRRPNHGNASTNDARVNAAFAQTDATQQAQVLNEAVLASANTTTKSTATGDIRLDTGEKKKKKWPVILLMIVVLAVAGGAVAYGILGGKNNKDGNIGSGLSVSDVVNFANYSLSEDGQDVLNEGYIGSRGYRLEQQIRIAQVIGENSEYFDGLGSTFDVMYNNTQETFNEETIFTSDNLTDMRDRISLIRRFVSGDMMTAQDMIFMYLNRGSAAMQEAVEIEAMKYATLEDNTIAKEYAAVIRETALMVSLTYDTYTQHGCIQDDTLNAECIASIPEGELEALDLSNDRTVGFIYDAARQVEQATFTIYRSINEAI